MSQPNPQPQTTALQSTATSPPQQSWPQIFDQWAKDLNRSTLSPALPSNNTNALQQYFAQPKNATPKTTQPSKKTKTSTTQIVTYVGITLVAILAAIIFLFALRKWYFGQQDDSQQFGFSLASLKKLRDQGEITDEEYQIAKERTRQQVLDAAQRRANQTKSPQQKSKLNDIMNDDHLDF